MCRWIAYLSPSEDCLLEDVLLTPAHGIAKQVHDHFLPHLMSYMPGAQTTEAEISLRNRLQNVDGFGLAWYTHCRSAFMSDTRGPRPASYKISSPPTKDPNFHSICANTSTTALFAHIRAATAGTVTMFNNHPFIFGRFTIMHNGDVANFSAIKRALLNLLDRESFDNLKGSTDSEHFAALYMTHLTKLVKSINKSESPNNDQNEVIDYQSPPLIPSTWETIHPLPVLKTALEQTITTIQTLQAKHRSTSLHPDEPNSLNICISDGVQLVALRYRNHAVEQPPSLYISTTAGVTLNRKYPDHPDGPDALFDPQSYLSPELAESVDNHNHNHPKSDNPTATAAAVTAERTPTATSPPRHPRMAYRAISAPNLNLNPDLSLQLTNSATSFRAPETHGPHVIVASEPTTYKDEEWTLIEKNCVVLVDQEGDVTIEKVSCG